MRWGNAFIISAPSGTGKSTLCARLLQRIPELSYSVSCTTRPMRQGEINGKDYIFMDKNEFFRRRDEGAFAEWAIVHGNCYGTPVAPVQAALANGRDILFDIDVQGAAQLHLAFPQAILIFILPPSLAELKKRLDARGTDDEKAISLRMRNAMDEIRSAPWYDYIVVNDDLEQAVENLLAIYKAACMSSICRRSLISELLSSVPNQ